MQPIEKSNQLLIMSLILIDDFRMNDQALSIIEKW
jgi:hypothetical protein